MTYTARHLLFAGLLGLLLGALAVASVRGASRSSAAAIPSSEFRPVGTNPHGESEPRRTTGTPILDPAAPTQHVERPAVAPTAELHVVFKAPRTTQGGSWRVSIASWYGPGFYGSRTACGQTLTEGLVGVAHKTLPCGTLVTFRAGGAPVTAPVVDRGPYIAGREWDLTAGLCAALRACSTGPIEWRL